MEPLVDQRLAVEEEHPEEEEVQPEGQEQLEVQPVGQEHLEEGQHPAAVEERHELQLNLEEERLLGD